MKKTKLLTSLAALALVVSLGGCDLTEVEDDTGDESTDTTPSTSEPEPEPTVLNNYTISISLEDSTGEPVAIPFYDTVYIYGSWDNWAEWTALTDVGQENVSVLTTTFATIEEGTYEFKGVIGGAEDTPSWNLTEFIISETGGNVSFTVDAEDGDSYTNNLTYTVDPEKIPVVEETLTTDADIIAAILEAAAKAGDEGLGWVAFHGQELDESLDDLTEVYLTTDENGDPYGYIYEYDTEDEEILFEYYYTDGQEYSYNASYGTRHTDEIDDTYEDFLDWYLDGLEPFAELDYEDREDWVLEHEENTYIYTLSIPDTYTDTITTRRAGDTFEIIAVSDSTTDWSGDLESISAELISQADVEEKMAGFNPWNWADAKDPAELIENIHESGCYTLEIEYDIYIASEGTTYGDYLYGNYDKDALEETLEIDTSYICDFYVTEDALLFEEYVYYDYGFIQFYSLVYSELLINDEDEDGEFFWDFILDNSYNWSLYGAYYYNWQYYYWSLFNEGEDGCFSANSFTYYGSGTYGGIPCTAWDLDSSAARSLFILLGTDWLFQSPSTATVGSYFGLGYFFEGLQELLLQYGYYGFTYYTYPTTWTDLLYLEEVFFYADIYDVGTTDIDDEIVSAFATLA